MRGQLRHNISLSVLGAALAQVVIAAPAMAQAPPARLSPSNLASTRAPPAPSPQNEVGEVIVTAEKRSTNLQRTPLAVTALTKAMLQDHEVRDLKDIQSLVPNFKMGDAEGVSQISVRGVGSSVFKPGGEGEVAVNENEIYVSRSVAQQSGLFDVSSLEVLRGPQGTLYGRNATAGAVNITTARPTGVYSGYGDLTFGNYNEVRAEGAVGGPIDQNGDLRLRIAGFYEHHDGYGKNLVTGHDIDDKNDYGARATLVYSPTGALQGTLIAEYFREGDHSGQFHYFGPGGTSGLAGASGAQPLFLTAGGYAPSNPRDIANAVDGAFGLKTVAVTSIIDWKSDSGFSVRSITGYRNQRAPFSYDVDGGSTANARGISNEPASQISQELQLHYDTNNLHVTAGGYFFHEDDNVYPDYVVISAFLAQHVLHLTPVAPYIRFLSQSAQLKTDAYAGYGQASYNLTSKLSLTAGVRYSSETKGETSEYGVQPFTSYPSTAPFPAAVVFKDATFSSVTPKFGVEYQYDARTLVYATYSKGFKSGGFDIGVANPKPFQPEKLTAYEGGVKTTVFDGRLRADFAAFYYDYNNLQVQQVIGLTVQTANAATATDYGLEGEVTYLATPHFEIDASGSYTHARYGQYCGVDSARPVIVTPSSCPTVNGALPANEANFSGDSLSNAPDWRGDLAAQYTFDIPTGHLIFRGEVEYSSRFYFAPNNFNFLSQDAYAKVDLFATYKRNSAWQLQAYVKNLGDRTTKTSATIASGLVGNPIIGSLAPPRTFGAQVSYRF